jgi:glycyl-radical enzyme activating protein family
MLGTVLKIDRGSKHDGPGLRTVVFLKGCPLRCKWCSTPDSQSLDIFMLHIETLCGRCGRCVDSCKERALEFSPDRVTIDRKRCDMCGKCREVCLNNAIRVSGISMTLDEVYNIVERSRGFWTRGVGGLTISGGEALFQFDFTKALLKKCHEGGIDTNIETSCFAPKEKIQELLPYLDHVCCDVKHMDDARHKELTGVSNKQIHDNIRLISHEKDLILRFPVIPTCNNSEQNIAATADFAKSLGPKFNRIDLLPYHELGTATYSRLGMRYEFEGVPSMKKAELNPVRDFIAGRGVRAVVA